MTPAPLFATLLAATSPPITRSGARAAARHELSNPVYHRHDPPATLRVIEAVLRFVTRLLRQAAAHSPGGWLGLAVIAVMLVLVVVAVRLRLGPLAGARAVSRPVFGATVLSADAHRRAADEFAARGRWAEAVRERLRAVVRQLETHGVLDERPGRTADEVAVEAGALLPALAADLRAATRAFDEVWYGGRTAGPDTDALLRRVDERVRRSRLAVAPAPHRTPPVVPA